MRRPRSLSVPALLAAAAAFTLAGCATPGGPAQPPKTAAAAPAPGAAAPANAASGAAPTAARPATPPQPGALPAFDTVVKDATKSEGLITVWRKDDKTWLEFKPEDFGRRFFLSPKIARGIGERMVYGGLMVGGWGLYGGAHLVEFQKVHNQVRLVALNVDATAKAGTPEARAVAAAFSPSLLASAAVASAPHPER